MKFSEHGLYRLHCDEQIIIFFAMGSWNEQATEKCIKELNHVIENVGHNQFGLIIDSSLIEGMTKESVIYWLKAIDYWNSFGHVATTRIDDPTSATYQIFLAGFDLVFQQRMKFSFSSSVEKGVSWMHQQGLTGFEDKPPAPAIFSHPDIQLNP